MTRRCPKCNRKMELLFNQWRCYYCNPPKNQKQKTVNKIKKEEEIMLWPWDDWNGWYE